VHVCRYYVRCSFSERSALAPPVGGASPRQFLSVVNPPTSQVPLVGWRIFPSSPIAPKEVGRKAVTCARPRYPPASLADPLAAAHSHPHRLSAPSSGSSAGAFGPSPTSSLRLRTCQPYPPRCLESFTEGLAHLLSVRTECTMRGSLGRHERPDGLPTVSVSALRIVDFAGAFGKLREGCGPWVARYSLVSETGARPEEPPAIETF